MKKEIKFDEKWLEEITKEAFCNSLNYEIIKYIDTKLRPVIEEEVKSFFESEKGSLHKILEKLYLKKYKNMMIYGQVKKPKN